MDRPPAWSAAQLEDDTRRRGLSVHGKLQRTRTPDDYLHRPNHNNHSRHVLNLSVWAVALLLPSQAIAQVNATASPSSVSNGSVVNNAVQMLNGPFPVYHLGPNQISCQGPTLSLSPFLTGSHSFSLPRRDYQRTPYYNPVDANEDGAPDYPGQILFWSKAPTGQKDSHSINAGIALTASFPLDGGLHERCKALADSQLKLMQQLLAQRVLDYTLNRLKHCSEMAKAGATFKPGSQAAMVCGDVQVIVPVKPAAKPKRPDSGLFAPGVVQKDSEPESFALALP